MSVVNTITTAATVAVAFVKANPVLCAGVAVGTLVGGYGVHRTVKYVKSKSKKEVTPSAEGIAAAPAALQQGSAIVVVSPSKMLTTQKRGGTPEQQAADDQLMKLTQEEAIDQGILAEWVQALLRVQAEGRLTVVPAPKAI